MTLEQEQGRYTIHMTLKQVQGRYIDFRIGARQKVLDSRQMPSPLEQAAKKSSLLDSATKDTKIILYIFWTLDRMSKCTWTLNWRDIGQGRGRFCGLCRTVGKAVGNLLDSGTGCHNSVTAELGGILQHSVPFLFTVSPLTHVLSMT